MATASIPCRSLLLAALLLAVSAPAWSQGPAEPHSTPTACSHISSANDWFDQEAARLGCELAASSDPIKTAALRAQLDAMRDKVTGPSVAAGEPARACDVQRLPVSRRVLDTAWRRASAPTGSAADLEAFVVLSVAADSRDSHVIAAAERLVKLAPTAGNWVLLARATRDTSRQVEALKAALQQEPANVPAAVALAGIYSSRSQPLRAREILNEALELRPKEPALLNALADLELAAGRGSAALAIYRELDAAPKKAQAIESALAFHFGDFGLLPRARELARSALLRGGNEGLRDLLLQLDEQALDEAALRRDAAFCRPAGEHAVQLARSDDAATSSDSDRRILELLHTGDAKHRSLSTYFADAQSLASQWQRQHKDGTSRVLADVREVRLQESYLAVQRIQRIIAIGNTADAETYSRISIPYSPESEQLTIAAASLFKADGEQLEAEEAGDSPVGDPSSGMYYDRRSRAMQFTNVQPGDVVNVEFELTPNISTSPLGKYFADMTIFGSNLAVDLQRLIVVSPASLPLSATAEHMPQGRVEESGDEVRRTWEARNISAIAHEPNAPSWTESAGYVHISTSPSWSQLGHWYSELISPQIALNDELRAAATAIAMKSPDPRERVNDVLDFVVRNTHYVALEFGVYGYKPHAATETYARRYGDCKDKATLMIALLKELGIAARLALLRTQGLGDPTPRVASVALFDHAIVYIPQMRLWVDPTAEFARLGELPVEDQGAMAFTVGLDGHSELLHVPRSTAAENHSLRTFHVVLHDDGTATFRGTARVTGEEAPGMRRDCAEPGESANCIRGRMAEVFPTIQVTAANIAGNVERDAVDLDFRGELRTFAGHKQVALPTSWIGRGYLSSLAPEAKRSQDLLLYAPWSTDEEITVELPAASLVSAPRDVTIESQFGDAHIAYSQSGDRFMVQTHVEFNTERIAAAYYSDFRNFLRQLDEAFRQQIEVRLP